MIPVVFLTLGAVFGFTLSRAGATTYDYYAQLFLFRDLQLLKIMATAIVVGAIGIRLLKRAGVRPLLGGAQMDTRGKPYRASLLPGALLFGVGWGLAAACPGTVLAMLGEGKLSSMFVIAGALLGTYLYGLQMDRAGAEREESAA